MQVLLYTAVQCRQHCLQFTTTTYHHHAIDKIPKFLTISRTAVGSDTLTVVNNNLLKMVNGIKW